MSDGDRDLMIRITLFLVCILVGAQIGRWL